MRTFSYRSANGIPLALEVDGEPPAVVVERGVRYALEEECADIAAIRREIGGFTTAPVRPKLRDHHFRAISQPRHWPYAPRHDTDGTPLYASRQEVLEAQAKAQDHGEQTIYDR